MKIDFATRKVYRKKSERLASYLLWGSTIAAGGLIFYYRFFSKLTLDERNAVTKKLLLSQILTKQGRNIQTSWENLVENLQNWNGDKVEKNEVKIGEEEKRKAK